MVQRSKIVGPRCLERSCSSTNKNSHFLGLEKITTLVWYPKIVTDNLWFLKTFLGPTIWLRPPNAWSGSVTGFEVVEPQTKPLLFYKPRKSPFFCSCNIDQQLSYHTLFFELLNCVGKNYEFLAVYDALCQHIQHCSCFDSFSAFLLLVPSATKLSTRTARIAASWRCPIRWKIFRKSGEKMEQNVRACDDGSDWTTRFCSFKWLRQHLQGQRVPFL